MINCPVCGYREVKGNVCPNCDTDLTIIHELLELSPVTNNTVQPVPSNRWILFTAIGIAVMVTLVSIFQFRNLLDTSFRTITVNPVLLPNVPPSSPVLASKQTEISSIEKQRVYTVKEGDTLISIVNQLCPQGTDWRIVVQANINLVGRENNLEIGDRIQVPCK